MKFERIKIFTLISFYAYSLSVSGGDYYKSDNLLFDFYIPQWINSPSNLNTEPSFSFSVSFGKDVQFRKTNFSWFYGLGYDLTNVNHNANFKSLTAMDGSLRTSGIRILNVPYSLNRLSSQYLGIPLELRYRTQTKNPFRFYLGTKAGYMINSSYELDEEFGDSYKRKNLRELENLKYGFTFRIGYGLFNLYTYYGLNGLMSSKRQRGVNELSFGLTLMAN